MIQFYASQNLLVQRLSTVTVAFYWIKIRYYSLSISTKLLNNLILMLGELYNKVSILVTSLPFCKS